MSRYRTDALIVVAIVAATLTAYWPLWRNGLLDHDDTAYGFIHYDDGYYVAHNPDVQAGLSANGLRWAFTTTHACNWHPLTWLSLQLDAQLYGLRPWGYHLTNLLLHLANGLLLYGFLRSITGAAGPSGLVAVLFAVHPLHVESVAWVSERKDVLSTFFGLLALWAYVAYAAKPTALRYLPVALAFGLSLLAKPMLVTLPCLLLLLDYWPLGRLRLKGAPAAGRSVALGRLVVEKLPLFVLALASCAATLYAQHHGGAVRGLEQLPLSVRVTNALVAYVAYLGKTFWPTRLAFYYPHPGGLWPWWQVIGAVLILAGVSAVALRTARRSPYLLVGWLWFLGTLVPVIGLVQVGGQAMADRYTYVPLIGVFVVVAWALRDAFHSRPDLRGVGVLAVCVLLPACVAACRIQVQCWHDDPGLWGHTWAVTDDNYYAAAALGRLLLRDPSAQDRALHYLNEALRLRPDDLECRVNRSAVLLRRERWEQAEEDARVALRIDPDNVAAHNNLGVINAAQNRPEPAAAEFAAAVRVDPENAEAQHNLGLALEQLGRRRQALDHCREAVRLQPEESRYHRALAYVLDLQGEADEARAQYRESVRLDPTWPEKANGMARSLATDPDPRQRNGPVSVRLARQACAATDGQRPEFLETLAAAYAATGAFDDAVATARKALASAEAQGRHDLTGRIERSLDRYRAERQAGHGTRAERD
jgi:Flp pilus assembly protein TadD